MSTSLLYHAFGIIGYFYQSTSYIAGAVIVAIRDDYWRLRCPVCRSRKVLGLNPVVLLGAITGSMTSRASLSVAANAAKNSVPALDYTGSYAFANVLLTICGSIILVR